MRKLRIIIAACICITTALCTAAYAKQLKVVTTLPDYAVFARAIGGSRVSVSHIVQGDQDAHFIRPKPSFATMVRSADVLIDTGLDLEMWLPSVIDASRNRKVRSGEQGYIATTKGMTLLEKPTNLSRSEGGIHIHGNPHMTCSPVMMRFAAKNIAYGLIKNDPGGKDTYTKNLNTLLDKIDRKLFGDTLVNAVGGSTLCSMAEKGTLITYLKSKTYKGKPMIDYTGGWMGKMLPLRGKPIVTYHKNWVYFFKLFGLEEAGTVEPKVGIPPSAKHVTELIKTMRERKIRIILAANYFPASEVKSIASKVDAEAVIVPLYVGGASGTDDYFKLVDCWVNGLVNAGRHKGLIK